MAVHSRAERWGSRVPEGQRTEGSDRSENVTAIVIKVSVQNRAFFFLLMVDYNAGNANDLKTPLIPTPLILVSISHTQLYTFPHFK